MRTKNMLIACCCLLILVVPVCTSQDEEIRLNKERGNQIIQAIDAYTQEHGQFPARLDDLVPVYIPEIPKTVGGEDFVYHVWYSEYYEVGFVLVSNRNRGCGYSSRYKDWECGFGD